MVSEGDASQNATTDSDDNSGQQDKGTTNKNPESPASGGEKHHPYACCNTTDTKQEKHWLEYATGVFAFVAAIGGILAAVFSGVQAWISNDSEKRQLRPYVNISTGALNNPPGTPIEWRIPIIIENNGATQTREAFSELWCTQKAFATDDPMKSRS